MSLGDERTNDQGKEFLFVLPENALKITYSLDWGGRQSINVKEKNGLVLSGYNANLHNSPLASPIKFGERDFNIGFYQEGQ